MGTRLAPALFLLGSMVASAALAQDARKLIAQGDSLLAINRPQKAMLKFDAALKLAPDADSHAARARGLYYTGKFDKALLDMEAALQIDSLHPQANYQRALYAFHANDQAGTVRYCTRALGRADKAPLKGHLLVLRGEAEAALKNNGKAIADLKEGLGDRVDDLPALKTLARLYDATGDHAASLAILKTLTVAEPGEIGNWSNLGFELNKLERYDEAIPALDHALKLDKDEPTVLSNKAYALLKLGRNEEAFTAVQHSLKAEPTNAYALRTRAMLYLRKGEADKACDDLTMAKAMGGLPDLDALIKKHCNGMPGKR